MSMRAGRRLALPAVACLAVLSAALPAHAQDDPTPPACPRADAPAIGGTPATDILTGTAGPDRVFGADGSTWRA